MEKKLQQTVLTPKSQTADLPVNTGFCKTIQDRELLSRPWPSLSDFYPVLCPSARPWTLFACPERAQLKALVRGASFARNTVPQHHQVPFLASGGRCSNVTFGRSFRETPQKLAHFLNHLLGPYIPSLSSQAVSRDRNLRYYLLYRLCIICYIFGNIYL